MGNHKLEQHWSQLNTTPLIVSKAIVTKTQKQHVRVGVIQSFNARIITTRVEMVVVPNRNVVKRGVLIKSVKQIG